MAPTEPEIRRFHSSNLNRGQQELPDDGPYPDMFCERYVERRLPSFNYPLRFIIARHLF
jgi:hypothetical protein